jgi:prepilin-type N-terminal cleavage/methylation domain-containing protein
MKTLRPLMRLNIDWAEECWAPKVSFSRFAVPVPRVSPLPLAPLSHRCYPLPLRQSPLFGSRGTRGFTLIELLVVIGIIAILAGILLPVIAGVKDKAKAATARSEMAQVITAINAYESEYSRPPASPTAESVGGDVTYGTVSPDPGSAVLKDRDGMPLPRIQTPGFNGDNRIIMCVIMNNTNAAPGIAVRGNPNLFGARNPRKLSSFNPRESRGAGVPGLDIDPDSDGYGVFRDPWGNPYIITIDMNDDNRCKDAYYSPSPQFEISGPVAVWSLGKDGLVEFDPPTSNNPPNPPKQAGRNKDNVLSWK